MKNLIFALLLATFIGVALLPNPSEDNNNGEGFYKASMVDPGTGGGGGN